jgi:hypothetical protein
MTVKLMMSLAIVVGLRVAARIPAQKTFHQLQVGKSTIKGGFNTTQTTKQNKLLDLF